MKEAEQLVGGPVAQLFSFVGIDVAHHQGDIILGKRIKTCLLRQDTPDHFVRDLDTALLIGALRVAAEHPCPPPAIGIELDGQGVCKLASPVSEDHREQIDKDIVPQAGIKLIEDIRDGLGGIVVPDEGKHEGAVPEVNRKKYLAALASFHGVHLNNRNVRGCGGELPKILIGSSGMALLVHPDSFFFFRTRNRTFLGRSMFPAVRSPASM